MPERRDSLSPPVGPDIRDSGAHDLETSDSEEHYSDAQSGPYPTSPVPASPIPRTRVEKVDDKPAYGEVPGTQAYRMREEDAEPDEIAIIPDKKDPSPPELEHVARSPTPGGHPIPKTVVEETPDAEGAVTHPEVEQRHKSDPHPDLLVKADGQRVEKGGEVANDTPISPSLSTSSSPARSRRKSSLALKRSPLSPGLSGPESAVTAPEGGGNDGDDEFGDDFNDFEEGDEDDDFGDFDDGFQEAPAPAPAPPPPAAPAIPTLSFPIPSFEDLDPPEIHSLTAPYLDALFPPPDSIRPLPSLSARENPVFLTPRSASLWSQLVAPPPLQPPDWIRSRIRRLFLVSLGVPIDLDEILPASSKQKKLGAGGGGKGKKAASDSGVGGGGSSSKIDPERLFDLVSARQRCMKTDAALNGMTDDELRAHVKQLEAMQVTARGVLEYWQKRTDEKIGDREAFEGVIENLVKHARKVRK
ncbi:hypothetical protein MMYC01_205049 [Madurella mycetomatis]|uniref:Uncharacterized protein n=1 Tax=Madurella mycetomatis TaxID=100816 RepID=A0A175W2B4_9PEZI|nr:hypothetical protein MMYC01_205049 [Madurella mycetomatis]